MSVDLSPEFDLLNSVPEALDRVLLVDGHLVDDRQTLSDWRIEEMETGVHLSISPGSKRGLALVHLPSLASTKVKISIPVDTHVQILEIWSGTGVEGQTECEVTVAAKARVDWLRWQSDLQSYRSSHKFKLAESAKLDWLGVQTGCRQISSNVVVELEAPQASVNLRGLVFGQADQSLENRLLIEHAAPKTKSTQLFKSVLRDHAKSLFAGQVRIASIAQKSDAWQRHHSLNFHSTAQSITQPELEIHADDVKAAHGATVGRVDDDELFYLESRGIRPEQGRQMLAQAFIADVLSSVSRMDVRQFVDQRLSKELPVFLTALESTP